MILGELVEVTDYYVTLIVDRGNQNLFLGCVGYLNGDESYLEDTVKSIRVNDFGAMFVEI